MKHFPPARSSLLLLTGLLALPAASAPAAPGAVVADAPGTPLAQKAGGGVTAEGVLPMDGSVNLQFPAEGMSVLTFEATEPGVLKVAVGGDEMVAMSVVTPEGFEAAGGFADNDEEGNWSERVEVPLFSPGTYRVMVEAESEVAAGTVFHLAAAFQSGEPAASETILEESVALMRALASPDTLQPDQDVSGELTEAGDADSVKIYRVEAEPGLYALVALATGDVQLKATSVEPGGWDSVYAVPDLEAFPDTQSDQDFDGDAGREGLVVNVPGGGTTWVAVSSPLGEPSSFSLKLVPLPAPATPGN